MVAVSASAVCSLLIFPLFCACGGANEPLLKELEVEDLETEALALERSITEACWGYDQKGTNPMGGGRGCQPADKWTMGSCAAGKRQSPINIKTNEVQIQHGDHELLDVKYNKMQLSLVNTGHNWEGKPSSSLGRVHAAGKDWNVLQYRFHSPSEHHVDGKQYKAELHIVHTAADDSGKLLVVGVMFDEQEKDNSFLTNLKWGHNDLLKKEGAPGCKDLVQGWASSYGSTCQKYDASGWCTVDGKIGPGWKHEWGVIKDYAVDGKDATQVCCACGGGGGGSEIVDLMDDKALGQQLKGGYWSYLGSLTTPECTEIVTWVVMKKTAGISQSQIAKFQKVFPHGNARPAQDLNQRTIFQGEVVKD